MSNRLRNIAILAAAVLLPLANPASAAPISVVAQNSWNGAASVNVGGVTISAFSTNTPNLVAGRIGIKAIPFAVFSVPGAGVQGEGNNEIDALRNGSEVLRFDFGPSGHVITNLILGLLFDGPEYSDWEEVARFDVTFTDATIGSFTLATNYVNALTSSSTWDGSATTWESFGVWNGGPGLWGNTDPFGGRAITRMDLYAANSSTCWSGKNKNCSDQSDFVFQSLQATAVPEPATLALLGLGLTGLGLARRKRRA